MSEKKQTGIVNRLLNRMIDTNQETHPAQAENTAKLSYEKGNLEQDKVKSNVWNTFPVLDEQVKPLKEY